MDRTVDDVQDDRLDRWMLLTAVALACGGLAVAIVGSVVLDVPFREFLVDRGLVAAGAHVGVLSTAGIMVWSVASAIALFAGLVVVGDPAGRRMLLSIGALLAVLAFDDAFLVHEAVVPELLGTRRLEPLLLAGYGVVGLVVLLLNRERIWHHRPWWLAVAVGLLGLSVGIDLFDSAGESLASLAPVEDVPKWFGIVLSGAWLVRTAVVESRAGAAPAAHDGGAQVADASGGVRSGRGSRDRQR